MANKKALFFSYQNLRELPGISKKILSQKKALENLGYDVSLSHLSTGETGPEFKIENETLIRRSPDLVGRLKWRFSKKEIFNWIIKNNISLIYVRYTKFADASFTRLFKKLKSRGVKIVLEIPTYPYDEEEKAVTLKQKVYKWMEKMNRTRMSKYVDKIATFSDDDIIFGRPTVKIINGVDSSIFPLKKENYSESKLNLIGVASLNYWHGYDRVLTGLADYYKLPEENRLPVFFHIVGGDSNNPEYNKLRALTKELALDNYVIFHGDQTGNALDSIFDESHIGIGSLGRHRNNIYKFQSLKNIEYGMRGIPFIYSEISPLFENENYIFKCPADDSPVNINAVIDFYRNNKQSPAEIRANCLEKNVEWTDQFRKILDSLKV